MNQVLGNINNVQPQYGGGCGFANNHVIRGLRMQFLRDGSANGPPLLHHSRRFADVESVEVPKGPGSAVYGSSSPGGVVSVISKQPSKTFGAAAELSAGYFGLRQITGGLYEKASGRLIFDDHHTDNFRGLAANIREVSDKLDYRINASNTLSFGYEHRENNNVEDNYGILSNTSGQVLDVPLETRHYSPLNKTSQNIDRFSVIQDLTLSNNLSLRNAAYYDKRKLDIVRNAGGNVATLAGVMSGRNGRMQKDEAGYTNLLSELSWKITGAIAQTVLLGAEHEVIRNTSNRFTYALPNLTPVLAPVVPEQALAGLAQTRTFDTQIGANTLSLCEQDQIEFLKEFKARAGLRVNRAKFFDDGFGNSLTAPTVANVHRKLDASEILPSWQLGLVYQPNNNLSFFADANKGRFLSIQTESINLDRKAEKSGQVEVEAKTIWLDEKLNLNVTFFQTTRYNSLVALTAGTDPLPVGQAKSTGFGIDLIGNPLPGWNIVGSFSQIDARSTGTELSVINGIKLSAGESVNGKKLPATPRNAVSLWTTYQLQTGDLKSLGFGAGFVTRGDSYADSLEKLKVPGYAIFNASVFYKVGKSEIALNLKNLTNAKYFSVPTFSGPLPGEPRQVLLNLRTKFQIQRVTRTMKPVGLSVFSQ